MDQEPNSATVLSARLGQLLNHVAVMLAYCGGVVVAGMGIMSAVSIIGRTVLRRPITGDFELVEIGTAIAGSLFLAYCQATNGNIAVDLFTLRASERTRGWLDRFGSLLMAVMFFMVGWRAAVYSVDLYRNGESSMLMRFPIWIGYVCVLPGVFAAATVALAQSVGIKVAGRISEQAAE